MSGVQKFKVSSISFGVILGQGGFGVVQAGTLNGKKIAVKILNARMKQDADAELSVMAELSHRNVLKLIGIIEENFQTQPKIIFEFMENGDLNAFLSRENAPDNVVMGLCYDVACGMDYLHEMQYIHRDLAGRNVLVDGQGRGKVADFGLSRFINEDHASYYKISPDKPIPIRWAPKEALPTPENNNSGRFSYASDVWAFGVTMWEAWTRGGMPYRTLSTTSNYVVVEEILKGKNPNDFEKPDCPVVVLDLMNWILQPESTLRPSFAQIKIKLGDLRSNLTSEPNSNVQAMTEKSSEVNVSCNNFSIPRVQLPMPGEFSEQFSIVPSLVAYLHSQVRTSVFDAKFSEKLTKSLTRLSQSQREEVIRSEGKDGSPGICVASQRGNLSQVEFLVQMGADLEQKGNYELDDEKGVVHNGTALWVAAVMGNLPIVRFLLQNGANVNTQSGTGSTAVRSACFEKHESIVKYLVEVGRADINIPNYIGGTCLMILANGNPTLCEYLLKNGAKVNAHATNSGLTALHYAIQNNSIQTVKLLLTYGADPFFKDVDGDDALQMSCLCGAVDIFTYLLETYEYSQTRRADACELMGTKFLTQDNDVQRVLEFWRQATEIRSEGNMKNIQTAPHLPCYARYFNGVQIQEYQTHADLARICRDMENMRIQALLIAERVLGSCHQEFIYRLRCGGAVYADSSDFPKCAQFLKYALERKIEKETLLGKSTWSDTLQLLGIYMELDQNGPPAKVNDLMGLLTTIVNELPITSHLIKLQPTFLDQEESYDHILLCVIHLLYLILKLQPTLVQSEMDQLKMMTERLVSLDLRTCSTGDTLLHMSVNPGNTVQNPVDTAQEFRVFPNKNVIKFLLECGGDLKALNIINVSPGQLLSRIEKFIPQMFDSLYDGVTNMLK